MDARRMACLLVCAAAGCAQAVGDGADQAVTLPGDLALPRDLALGGDGGPFDLGDMAKGPACPTGTIPPSVNTLYAGDTTAGPNLATDSRVGWGADPDHALLFVAPKSGNYLVSITSTNQPGTDCGVVLRRYGTGNNGALLDETSCPAPGMTAALDGAYAATPGGGTTTIALGNAQHVVLWVSCSSSAPLNRTIVYDVKLQYQ